MSEHRKAELSWNRLDYKAKGIEAPEMLRDEVTTEGSLMNEEEVEAWFLESIKVMRVVRESDPATFERLYAGFVLDVKYLVSLSKIPPETVEFVQKQDNLKW